MQPNQTDTQTVQQTEGGGTVASSALLACVEALNAVLLFHSGSPWDFEKSQEWDRITRNLLPEPKRHEHNWRENGLSVKFDATTRTLCDVARAALKQVNDKVSDRR